MFRSICGVGGGLRKKLPFSNTFFPQWPGDIPLQRPGAFTGERAKDQLLVLWNWVRLVGKNVLIEWSEVNDQLKRSYELARDAKQRRNLNEVD
jgi:hypothetical protein